MPQTTNTNIELRAESVQDILTKTPHWMLRWGNLIILSILILIFFFSWLIKYPDIVTTEITITSSIPPEKIIAHASGRFDEILVKELYPKRITGLTEDEFVEIEKTIMYSGNRLLDTFNIGKSIWSIVYESTAINLKKNKKTLNSGRGFVYLPIKDDKKVLVWEFFLKKYKGDTKMYLKLIWEGDPQGLKIFDICLEKTTWLDQEIYKLPMFEVISNNKFPLEETLIPIIKRKIFGYIYQTVPTKEILHFDSSKLIS
jgi:hypothetical protein